MSLLAGRAAGRATQAPCSSSSSSSYPLRRSCCPAAPAIPISTSTRPRPTRTTTTTTTRAAPSPQAPPTAPPADIVRLPLQVVAAGGIDLSREPPERVRDFAAVLRQAFVPVDLLAFAGTRVLNVDPPVLVVDEFLPAELCDRLRGAAEASGRMQRSRVGGSDTPSGGGASDEGIRTSTTLAIGREALAASPELDAALSALLERAEALFCGGGDGEGGGNAASSSASSPSAGEAAGEAAAAADSGQQQQQPQQQQQRLRLRRGLFTKPAPGNGAELVAEMPQVARYLPGQHFLAHEDAFPPSAALERGFQRRATLLVYLNDVPQGGRTRFEHLGPLDVAPKKGRAAVFFPAFRGGRPDARTLHSATGAAEGHEKWVFQLWLTSAVAAPAAGGGGGGGGSGSAATGTSKRGGGAGPPPTPLLPPRGGGGKAGGGGGKKGKSKRR